jgi:integrase
MPLTDTRIRSTKSSDKPIKLTDGGGLILEIRPTGAKLWRLRYRIAGKENMYALGAYVEAPKGESEVQAQARRNGGDYTLAEARVERERCRRLIKQGIHPAHQRQAVKAETIAANQNTFEAVAREWVAQNRERWTPYYLRQVERFMASEVYRYVGSMPIRSLSAAQMLEVVKRTELRAPTVALMVRQWCSAVFRFAVATLRADGDPTVALKGAIARKKVQHHKPLRREDIPAFLASLQSYGGAESTKIALRLLMLTFVRPIELRAARWSEFDLKNAIWRVPAERMKMRESHVVPLPRQAVSLLEQLQGITGKQDWLFPNRRRPATYMTGTTLNRALENMGYGNKFSSHGFRATASTILNEMNFRPDVIERQLAHAPKNRVRAAYNQAEYLEERRAMMQTWADLVAAESGKIVPIGVAASA